MYQTKQVDVTVDFKINEAKSGMISLSVMKRVLRYLLSHYRVTSVIRDYFILDSSSVERCFTLYKENKHCVFTCEITSDERDWYTQFECDVINDKIELDSIEYESYNCK